MTTILTEKLAARVRAALQDADRPLWLPDLTLALTLAGWHKLRRELRLTPASYGTARMLRRNPDESRLMLAYIEAPLCNGTVHDTMPIELLSDEIARECAGPHVRFFRAEEALRADVPGSVKEALGIIDLVPTLLATVLSLIRSLHVIVSADDNVDISFSDPDIPFSAFVSVPTKCARHVAFRVAEAMLHEAMHLQLTLLERFVPLVKPNQTIYFSPWREQFRSSRGVLHALYVFRVIESFLGAPRFEGPNWAAARPYVQERRATIVRQVQQVRGFRECNDLTSDGIAFVARLLI